MTLEPDVRLCLCPRQLAQPAPVASMPCRWAAAAHHGAEQPVVKQLLATSVRMRQPGCEGLVNVTKVSQEEPDTVLNRRFCKTAVIHER